MADVPRAASGALRDLRVVVVEDQGLVALQLKSVLGKLGCTVVGQAADLESAWRVCDTVDFDVALLDVNLRGERVYPLAEKLQARNCPFVLTTGYDPDTLPAPLQEAQLLQKPYDSTGVAAALRRVLVA